MNRTGRTLKGRLDLRSVQITAASQKPSKESIGSALALATTEELRGLRQALVVARNATLAKEYTSSYWAFFKAMWSGIESEELSVNWHMEYLCDQLQELAEYLFRREQPPQNLIINIAPGETKSRIVSVFWPVWCWVNDPTLRFITTSYAGNLALELNMRSRDLLESPNFIRYFSDIVLKRDLNAKSFYGNVKGGHRYAAGIGGSITGQHAHIVIIDDPVNPKQAASSEVLANVNYYIDQTLLTRRLRNMSAIVLVMQRLADGDPTQHLADKWSQNNTLKHIKIPSTLEYEPLPSELAFKYTPLEGADGQVQFVMNPERSGLDFLDDQRISLGSQGYACQHGQEPTAKGGNIWKDHMLQFRYKFSDIAHTNYTWNIVVDTAYTDNSKNDETAMIAYSFRNGLFYIREVDEVHLEFPKMLQHVQEFALRNGAVGPGSYMYVEPKANGKDLVASLRSNTKGLNPVESKPPTKDKLARANDTLPVWEAGRVLLPDAAPWVDLYTGRLKAFPKGKAKGLCDCTSIMIYEHHQKPGNEETGYGMRTVRINSRR